MKKMLNNIKNNLNQAVMSIASRANTLKAVVANNSGEGYIDTAVKILIAVVLGGLLLAGLYALFGQTLLPTLTNRIQQMFNYNGASH